MNAKKNKIAIITLNGYYNYGNKLQNYALECTIRKMGHDVETLVFINDQPLVSRLYDKIKQEKLRIIISGLNLLLGMFNKKVRIQKNDTFINREKAFRIFSDKYLNEKIIKIDKSKLKTLNEYYDYFVTGSDQVWNPMYFSLYYLYFLTFAENSKKIAYAPSFGVSVIDKKYVSTVRNLLNEFPKISVREESGARIIKELTGKDSEILIDPTMLLDKQEWLKIINSSEKKTPDHFILTYFLGDFPEDIYEDLELISEKNNLTIVRLGDISDKGNYETSPSEFLDYVNKCSILLTDSFHGVVFSILFKKPFIVFKRKGSEDMYTRISSLLEKLRLHHREFENIKLDDSFFNIDYSHVDEIVKHEREKSINFLKGIIDNSSRF